MPTVRIMREVILCCTIVILSVSCKKESNTSRTLTGKYQSASTANVDPAVMYVQNKRMTDTAVINPYLRKKNTIALFTFSSAEPVQDSLLLLDFKNNNTVDYTRRSSLFYSFTATLRNLSPVGFVIENNDSIIVAYINPFSTQNFFHCDTLNNLVLKVSDRYHYNIFTGVPNYTATYIATPRFPLIEENGQLFLPLMTVSLSASFNYSNNSGSCSSSFKNDWNIPADNIESKLALRDTVVVQTKKVLLR
jgi:hypothetical protein